MVAFSPLVPRLYKEQALLGSETQGPLSRQMQVAPEQVRMGPVQQDSALARARGVVPGRPDRRIVVQSRLILSNQVIYDVAVLQDDQLLAESSRGVGRRNAHGD